MNVSRDLRIGIVNPAHWHFPMYRTGLEALGIRPVGIVEEASAIGEALAADIGCSRFDTVEALCERARPDFIFAFGEHGAQPAIARELIARRIPFSIEKPGGLRAADVADLERLASAAGLFVATPFHYRLSEMARALSALDPAPAKRLRAISFDVQARTPLQHARTAPWLTDPARAGGGVLINLGHHPIDFACELAGDAPVEIEAETSNTGLGLAVEDRARLHLRFATGATCRIDVGYHQPLDSDRYMGFALQVEHAAFSAHTREDRLIVSNTAGLTALLPAHWSFRRHFSDYVIAVLSRFLAGQQPVAGLGALLRSMRVIDAAYASAAERRAVSIQATV